jgi:hypothetical protein
MKSVSTTKIKAHALKFGGKLEANGRVVNVGRAQVQRQPLPPAAPAAAPAAYMPDVPEKAEQKTIPTVDPVLREAVIAIDRCASASSLFNESNVLLMQGVQDVLKKISAQEPQKRPHKWVFVVKRDAHGLMERIEATAVFQ